MFPGERGKLELELPGPPRGRPEVAPPPLDMPPEPRGPETEDMEGGGVEEDELLEPPLK